MKRTPGYQLDLKKPVYEYTPEEILHLNAMVEQHGVVCIKNQNLEADEMVEFLKKLGNPMALPEGLAFYNQ